MNESMWTGADKRTYPISIMSSRHLDNTILMLKRQGYVTMAEAGPMPTDGIGPGFNAALSAQMIWASKVTSPQFEQLVVERLRRLTDGISLDDEDAQRLQDEYEHEQWQRRARAAGRYNRNVTPLSRPVPGARPSHTDDRDFSDDDSPPWGQS